MGKPRGTQVLTVYLNPLQYETVRLLAFRQHLSLTEWSRRAVSEMIRQQMLCPSELPDRPAAPVEQREQER